MANGNFIVQNGLTVGPITIDAVSGNITTTGNIITTGGGSISSANGFGGLNPNQIYSGTSNVTVNSGNVQVGVSGGNVLTIVPATLGAGNVVLNGSIIPGANVQYDLGSRTNQWHSIFVGPGTLYVNGKSVIQDNSGTITFSTDVNQNLSIQTSGTGDIQVNPSGTGAIALQGPIKVTAGKYFTSSDGNAIGFSNQVAVDSITSKTTNTNLSLSAAGTGKIQINNNITGGGTITFSDATASTSTNNGAVVVTGGVGVGGDLRVAGNVYSYGVLAVQSQTLTVNTPLVYLAATPYPYSFDIGVYSHFVGGAANAYGHTGFVRSQANNYWGLFANVASEPTTSVNWTDGSLVWDTAKMGALILANSTASTSTTTGALQVAGGAGIAGQLNVGANVTVTGSILPSANVTYNLGSTTARWKDLFLSGNTIDLGGTTMSAPAGGGFSVATGSVYANANIASTGVTSGALVVPNGGAGISGNVFAGGWIIPTGNTTQNLGTTTNWWGTLYGVSTQAKYADLAENYQADKPYIPGTVLQFGGTNEVTVADADTTRVAGVVSTNPAHLMNGALSGANVVALALTGRVPCMVIGPVAKGDIMVSAGHGYAKVNNSPAPGQAIGKSIEDFATQAKGVIEVLVGKV